jgi:hypothetical protein
MCDIIPLSVSNSISDLPIDFTATRRALSDIVWALEGVETTLK